MDLSDLIAPEGIITSLKVDTKKHVLENISALGAKLTGLDKLIILESLLQRESLGSTNMGNGIAIPHTKIHGVTKVICLFAQLDKPVKFDSEDNDKVDLVFALLAPESAGADHLRALARISRLLRDTAILEKLRSSNDPAALYAMLNESVAAA